MFAIKKLLGTLIMPLPLSFLLLLVGLIFLMKHRRRLASLFGGLALLILYGFSLPWVAGQLVRPLEREFPAYSGAPVDYVVVLGGAHVSDTSIPPGARLASYSLYRLHEGIRIYDANADARLIFSGYAGLDSQPHALAMEAVAQSMGVLGGDIITESRPQDTAEEASYLRSLLLGQRFALVTSATHMPRAMYLFRQAGLNPVSAPAEYLAGPTRPVVFWDFIPDARAQDNSRRAWHEYIGLFWARITEAMRTYFE